MDKAQVAVRHALASLRRVVNSDEGTKPGDHDKVHARIDALSQDATTPTPGRRHTYLTSSCNSRDPLRSRPFRASHHAPRTAGVAPNSTGLIRPPHTRKRRLANDEGAARTPVVHPGFCLCTPYLFGPRSTYDVAAPIAARHKTVYVGCEADTWWRSTASATATDSASECINEWSVGWDSSDDVPLAGTGIVWQQLDVDGRMSLPLVCLLKPSTQEGWLSVEEMEGQFWQKLRMSEVMRGEKKRG